MKIAIYTAIFGEKDTLRHPVDYNFNADVDYFLITDNENIKSDIYTVVLKEVIYQDIAKNARYYKILGLEKFKNYDFTIWHDANIQLKQDAIWNLIELVESKQLAAFKHPKRNNFYDEAIACIKDKKEDPLTLFHQCLIYFFKNHSPYSGLYETGILVRNLKSNNKKFFKEWWNQVNRFSRRDQISFPPLLHKFAIEINSLQGEGINSPYAIYHRHSYYKYITSRKKIKLSENLNRILIKIIRFLKVMSKKINQ